MTSIISRGTRAVALGALGVTLAACSEPGRTPAEPLLERAPAAQARAGNGDASDEAPLAWEAPNTPGTLREAVLDWNDVITAFFHPPVFVPGQPPPRDAHDYAMASAAIHDVLNAIDRRYEPFAYLPTASTPVSGQAAIAAAVRGVLDAIGATLPTPAPRAFANARYAAALAAIPDSPQKTAGIALGQAVAAAVLAARAGDGSAGPPAQPFASPGTPGAFRPLIPSLSAVALNGVAALPYWGTVRPFALPGVVPFRSASPYGAATLAEAIQTPQYLADYAEVQAYGGVVSQRSAEQTEIGLYWIESSAQGWNRVARAILAKRQQTAWRAARLLAQMHLAIADAYIANFDSKYYWRFWRPVTAVRLGNMNAATPGNPTWEAASMPNFGPTPPVPEWPSAHAMAGAAAAEAIKANVPGTTAFSMEATSQPGRVRHFESVDEAVTENNLSRVYVGFHFRASTTEGERLGRQVGRYVADHALMPARR